MSTSRLQSHHSLPAPVVHASFSVSQSKSHVLAGVQDAYWSDDEAEDAECPLCLEEMDVSDLNFKPCICGYQICRFCWHHIKENLNKRCPACRRVYTDDAVEFKPIATQDHKRLTQQKKQRERERKELDTLGRRHLANVRVVQRNVVYVVGIGPKFAKEELIPTLRSNEYFGQYGKITKILLVKRTPSGGGPPVIGLYITYHRREDAARSIAAVDGAASPGGGREVMRASYGTTKYCMAFLRGVSCNDQSCMNLHEWGDEKDCFTKEDLTTLKHTIKATESRSRNVVVSNKKADEPDAGLPRAAAWAQKSANSQPFAQGNSQVSSTSAPIRQSRRNAVTRQPRNILVAASNSSDNHSANVRIPHSESKSTLSTKTLQPSSSRPATPASSSLRQRATLTSERKPRQDKESALQSALQQPQSPALSTTADSDHETGSQRFVPSSPAVRPNSTDSSQSSVPSLPPGLPIVPPGLSAPPGIPSSSRLPRFENASPETPLLASQSSYQMSTAAQALLDDVKARRESALPTAAGLGPFPDFDRTLQTLSGGDGEGFSFNLDPKLVGDDAEHLPSLSGFQFEAEIPFHGSYIDAFPALRASTVPGAIFVAPPGLSYPHHSNSSIYNPLNIGQPPAIGIEKQAPSGPSYTGTFNPFADGGEEALAPPDILVQRSQHSPFDDDSTRKVSRFGFARGRQGSTFQSPTPFSPSNSNGDVQSFSDQTEILPVSPALVQRSKHSQHNYDHTQPGSPVIQGTAPYTQYTKLQSSGSSVTEAQLRDLIQSSRSGARSFHTNANELSSSVAPGLTQFNDPAIVSAPLVVESINNQISYGPPPGLSYPHTIPPSGLPNALPNSGIDNNGVTHALPTPSPALSSSDFPALTASPMEPTAREEPIATIEDTKPPSDAKAQAKAERKAAKKAAAAEKAAERQKVTQERAASRAAERAKVAQERMAEKERVKAQEKLAKEQSDKEKAAKVEGERLLQLQKVQSAQIDREKPTQVKKPVNRRGDDGHPNRAPKTVQQVVVSKAMPTAPVSVTQVPLLSKKPKKNKPSVKPARIMKEEEAVHDDASTIPSISASEGPMLPTDSSSNNSRSHSLDRNTPTPIQDLLEDIDILNPGMDLLNHPFFDIRKLSPAASVPLEYGPLVHALSALSVGGGSFANNMPSGSIDNAVSSFQQLLETLTQTISDLLRLLPRTTWDDSSSFDGVLRDMLKGDDFLEDGDDGHGREDEVAALTLALERRARWMEVQLSKLEELHRDINTAAVRAVLSFNDNGWDRHGFMPRVGNTLHRFDNIGLTEDCGVVRPMNTDELEKKLAVAREAAVFAETEVREAMERIQSIRPL